MNDISILKALKPIQIVASVAAVASAVAGTVMVVKAVSQYQEDSINAINKAETEGYETDEEAKEATEKLQNDALKVVVASVGTVVVSGVFALIAHKAYAKRCAISANGIISNLKRSYETALDSTYTAAVNNAAMVDVLLSDDKIGTAKELMNNKDSISKLIDAVSREIYFQEDTLAEKLTKDLVNDRKNVYELLIKNAVTLIIDHLSETEVK